MFSRPELEKFARQELALPEALMPSANYSQVAAKDVVAREGRPESALVLER
jgi:hypothetical protein